MVAVRLDGWFGKCEHLGMITEPKISNPIAAARDKLEWSQSDLARALGLKSKSYICEIEKGKAPSLHVAIGIYRHLGVKTAPIADLTDREIAILEKTAKSRAH